ncbi:MAG: hypothetical protein WCJ33_01270 [Pseudomonadota bacterium]
MSIQSLPKQIKLENRLINSKLALQFLYEESLREEDKDVTNVIRAALDFCNDLIEQKNETLTSSEDDFLYFGFLRAILELNPQTVKHLLKIVKWLEISSDSSEIDTVARQKKQFIENKNIPEIVNQEISEQETLRLNNAYKNIMNPNIRNRLFDLIESISE